MFRTWDGDGAKPSREERKSRTCTRFIGLRACFTTVTALDDSSTARTSRLAFIMRECSKGHGGVLGSSAYLGEAPLVCHIRVMSNSSGSIASDVLLCEESEARKSPLRVGRHGSVQVSSHHSSAFRLRSLTLTYLRPLSKHASIARAPGKDHYCWANRRSSP